MRKLSSIQSTRRGFLYQDSYAIFCYLKNLADKKIKKFYIDFPLENKNSLDIIFLDSQENEHIFEVKSGDCFPERPDDIKKALINLHKYWLKKENTILNLIIRKGYRNKIMETWTHIQILNENMTLHAEKTKNASVYIQATLSTKTPDDAHKFCKCLKLESEYDDVEEYSSDKNPPLIDASLAIIKDLSSKFGTQESEFEYPNELLIFQLLCEVVRCAGSQIDLHPRFSEIIVNFFTRRRLFAQHYKAENSKEITENTLLEIVKEIFAKEFSAPENPDKISVISVTGEGTAPK